MSDLYRADIRGKYGLEFFNGVTEKSWVNHCNNTRLKAETLLQYCQHVERRAMFCKSMPERTTRGVKEG